MINRRTFLYGSGVTLLGAALPSLGQERVANGALIFGQPPGSYGAKVAEGLLPMLATYAGLDYQVQYVTQRNTRAAGEAVKRARPDGKTLLQTMSASMSLFPSVYTDLPYDPLKDFTPLMVVGDFTYTLAVGPAVPPTVHTIDDYIAWVSRNPEYRDLGVALYGSPGHLAGLMLARKKDIALRIQPYMAVTAAIKDMLNKSLAASIIVTGLVTSSQAQGQLRALAVTSRTRFTKWPNVPTLGEQGVPTDINGWIGWFAPAHLSSAVSGSLFKSIALLQSAHEFSTFQSRMLMSPVSLSSEQITERIRQEITTYRALIQEYGLSQMS